MPPILSLESFHATRMPLLHSMPPSCHGIRCHAAFIKRHASPMLLMPGMPCHGALPCHAPFWCHAMPFRMIHVALMPHHAMPRCTLPPSCHHAADHGAADVRPLLRAARQAVLSGVCVLFSRVVPLDCKDPSVHPLWQLALKVRHAG